MTKAKPNRGWPGILSKKECSLIIRLRFSREIEKRYHRNVPALCKISGFRLIKSNQPKNLDAASLESIVSQVKETSH